MQHTYTYTCTEFGKLTLSAFWDTRDREHDTHITSTYVNEKWKKK